MEIKNKWKKFAYLWYVAKDKIPEGHSTLDAYEDLMRCCNDDDVEVILDTYSIEWHKEAKPYSHMEKVLVMLTLAEKLQIADTQE